MYVCICNGVTEKDIREAVDDGAVSLGCLKQRLGVSECCGQCESRASELLQNVSSSAAPLPVLTELRVS